MGMQATIFLLLALLVSEPAAGALGSTASGTSVDPVMDRLGYSLTSSSIEGTMSLEGTMTIGSLPFSANLRGDTIAVTLSAPFGMTAGRLYATSDTFVVVNYLSREVLEGHPESESIASVSPIPLKLTDVRAFMRGTIPGDLSRFKRGAPRSDAKVLFVARDTAATEFVLVDTMSMTVSQYQRKSPQGKTQLNLVLGDVRSVDTVGIAHAIDVDLDEATQSVRFRFDSIQSRVDAAPLRIPEVPPSFNRRVYK